MGAQLARRACRLGQEKPAQHKAVMSLPSFLLKSLPFRQKTWPPRWEQAPPPGAAFGVQKDSGSLHITPTFWGRQGLPQPQELRESNLLIPSPLRHSQVGSASACLKRNLKSVTSKI